VPVLQLDDGAILTEGPVISQYLADQKGGSSLVPANGTMERYRLQELLGYINSEIHKTFSPLFNPATSEETRNERKEYLKKRYAFIDKQLEGKSFLTGEQFTVADAYLFTVTNWAAYTKTDISDFKHVAAFQERVAGRPAVREAMKAEGLLKE
jgi:glutathione S-transferase